MYRECDKKVDDKYIGKEDDSCIEPAIPGKEAWQKTDPKPEPKEITNRQKFNVD
jgi:hypothetical protein